MKVAAMHSMSWKRLSLQKLVFSDAVTGMASVACRWDMLYMTVA
jgi:hypothetical protein